MNQVITNKPISGVIDVPESKSLAHRYLIIEALANEVGKIECHSTSDDILATIDCLRELGLREPLESPQISENIRILDCKESGTTYRFLLPIAAALGKTSLFVLHKSLVNRPMDPLFKALKVHGIRSEIREDETSTANYEQISRVLVTGKLTGGSFILPGNVSSQFISGLMLSLPLLEVNSTIIVEGSLESTSYVAMTMAVMRQAGIKINAEKGNGRIGYTFKIPGNQKYHFKEEKIAIEKDWSSAAFFLTGGAVSGAPLTCIGLNPESIQGDKRILNILKAFGANVNTSGKNITINGGHLKGINIDARDIPDIIPAVAVLACAAFGNTKILNAKRLRYKESDRLETISKALNAIGAKIEFDENSITITGLGTPGHESHPVLAGGNVNSYGDHRIAMMLSMAACISKKPVQILNSEVVNKSYPGFYEDLKSLQ